MTKCAAPLINLPSAQHLTNCAKIFNRNRVKVRTRVRVKARVSVRVSSRVSVRVRLAQLDKNRSLFSQTVLFLVKHTAHF